jgi:AraC-like DNA-binding protein
VPDRDAQPGRRGARDAAASTAPPPHINRITTRNADELQAWITAQFSAEYKRKILARRRGFEYFAESGPLGKLATATSGYAAATVVTLMPAMPFVAVCQLVRGRYLIQWQGGEVQVTDGQTILFPSTAWELLAEDSRHDGITLNVDAVRRVGEETSGIDQAYVGFTGLLPVSPAAERRWLATADYIRHGIYTRTLDQPLLIAAAEQLVATVMLATFPNTTMTIENRTPRDPATPATIRRAITFIDEHANEPITLTDIATAAGVTPRTLQYAFRRHRDTTPLAYLRRVRLNQAHEELLAAEPGDGTTIAAVAARWGYANPNRFTAAYQEVYGQPPSHTGAHPNDPAAGRGRHAR